MYFLRETHSICFISIHLSQFFRDCNKMNYNTIIGLSPRFWMQCKLNTGRPEQDTTGHTFDFYTIRLCARN
jgi:hypothetical protein